VKRPLVPYDGDTLKDIEGVPMEYFWERCEELLPDDWALQLTMRQHEGFPVYMVLACLVENGETAHGFQSRWRSTRERALEEVYYLLRDNLLPPSLPVPWPGIGEDEGSHDGEEGAPGDGEPEDGEVGVVESEPRRADQ
jgi:hypothetical protein